MWLRYPVAISVAYCVFLLLLALWLWLHRRNRDLDPPDLDFIPSDLIGQKVSLQDSSQFGGGGDFSGGGAGGSWGESGPTSSSVGSSDGSVPDIGLDLDLEEGWIVVIAIVALVGGVIASFYIIYIAPALLAEILVDGALVAGLYKRVKQVQGRHWLRAAVRRTILPAFLVALCFTVAGYALQKAVPEANTIGEVWNHARGK